jgi:hypothetical protein
MRALVFSLAIALPCSAQPVAVAPWMTGERLVAMITFPSRAKGNFDLTREQFLAAERARLYIEGVHDATEGKSWCFSERYRPGPDALRDQAEVGLRALPRDQLKRNAADLIAEIWRNKWPCANGRSSG